MVLRWIYDFDVQVTVYRDKCLYQNQLDALISQVYFWNKTLHVSDSSSVHHQEFFYCKHSNGICHRGLLTACEQDQDGTAVPSRSCSQAVSKFLWHIPLLCVQWKTSDDGQRNCPKHVEFYSQNRFEKLVRLVGFNIRMNLCAIIKIFPVETYFKEMCYFNKPVCKIGSRQITIQHNFMKYSNDYMFRHYRVLIELRQNSL